MQDDLSADVDEDAIRSLAGEYLSEYSEHVHKPELKKRLERKVEEWEEKLAEIDPDDPLRDRLENQYRQSEQRLQEIESQGETSLTRRLLSKAADDFVAEGVWLETKVIRAINLALFNKYSDEIVVQREPLDDTTVLDDQEVYEISTEVRRLASERLEELED